MKKVMNALGYVENGVMVATFIALVLLNFLNVLTRYLVPSLSVAYNEELSLYIFVWLCMFGASVCFRENEHLSLPLFYDMFPPTVRVVLSLIGNLVIIFAISMMTYYTYLMVINQLEHNVMAQSMNIPTAVAGIAMPIGGVAMIIRMLENSVKAVKNARAASAKGEEMEV